MKQNDDSVLLPAGLTDREKRQIAAIAAEMAADKLEERMRLKKLFLTEKEAAEVLGLSPASLKQMRYTGDGPAFVRMGDGPKAPVRYPRESVNMWARLRPRYQATREEYERDVFEAH